MQPHSSTLSRSWTACSRAGHSSGSGAGGGCRLSKACCSGVGQNSGEVVLLGQHCARMLRFEALHTPTTAFPPACEL